LTFMCLFDRDEMFDSRAKENMFIEALLSKEPPRVCLTASACGTRVDQSLTEYFFAPKPDLGVDLKLLSRWWA